MKSDKISNIPLFFQDMKKDDIQNKSSEVIELFNFVDQNGDNVLDQLELSKYYNSSVLSTIDNDGDGALSTEEIKTATEIRTLSNYAKHKIKSELNERINNKAKKAGIIGTVFGSTASTLILGGALKTGQILLTTAPIAVNVGLIALPILATGLICGVAAYQISKKLSSETYNLDDVARIFNECLGEYKDHPYAKIEYGNLLKELEINK